MSKRERPEEGTGRTTWLLMGLVVVATVGIGLLLRSGQPEADRPAVDAAQEVVEPEPYSPRGTIVSASWRDESSPEAAVDGERSAPAEEESSSLLDSVDWGDAEADRGTRFERSLEKQMKHIQGLAVAVDRGSLEKEEK